MINLTRADLECTIRKRLLKTITACRDPPISWGWQTDDNVIVAVDAICRTLDKGENFDEKQSLK